MGETATAITQWSPLKFLAFTIFEMPQRPRGETGSSRGK